MKSFEQASGVMNVSAPDTHPSMGPAGDACHMQIASGAGSDKPMRSMKKNESGGYHVTSSNPTPSKTMELSKRP